MATFFDNLRSSTKLLPTFTPPFPTTPNTFERKEPEEQKEPMTQELWKALRAADAENAAIKQDENFEKALNGSLFVNNLRDVVPSSMTIDDRFTETASKDVYNNYDTLNKVIDMYDVAPTAEAKIDVLKKAWNDVGASNWKKPDWFLAFEGWTRMAEELGDDFNNVSNVMRQINEVAKEKYSPKRF